MTRYVAAILAALTFTFTGEPSGLRLLAGLAAANLCLHVWGRIRGPIPEEVDA